jgi:hypothetical protein
MSRPHALFLVEVDNSVPGIAGRFQYKSGEAVEINPIKTSLWPGAGKLMSDLVKAVVSANSPDATTGNSDRDLIPQARCRPKSPRSDRWAVGDFLLRRGFIDRGGLQCLPHGEL